jgi:hypothetical protein
MHCFIGISCIKIASSFIQILITNAHMSSTCSSLSSLPIFNIYYVGKYNYLFKAAGVPILNNEGVVDGISCKNKLLEYFSIQSIND